MLVSETGQSRPLRPGLVDVGKGNRTRYGPSHAPAPAQNVSPPAQLSGTTMQAAPSPHALMHSESLPHGTHAMLPDPQKPALHRERGSWPDHMRRQDRAGDRGGTRRCAPRGSGDRSERRSRDAPYSSQVAGGRWPPRRAAMMAQAAAMSARTASTAAGSRTLPLGVRSRMCKMA